MSSIQVKSKYGDYQVCVGEKITGKVGSMMKRLGLKGKVLIITQKPVAAKHLAKVRASLKRAGLKVFVHFVPNSEAAKSERELSRIYKVLLRADFERGDNLLALGGGVVGDLTGFAAATYLRGVAFVSVATTLLAQVDSSVGGKTGINLAEGKNLVGAFYPARLVLLDVATLKTLPKRNFQASLAEVVKYGMIRDAKFFKYLERNAQRILKRDPRVLKHIVLTSAKIKAGVVTRDEHETKGERMILNFGHTFGHAFEKVLKYKRLVHGEAVAIGMVCAARLGVELKMFTVSGEKRLVALLQRLGLPISAAKLDMAVADVLKAMSHDKKKQRGKLRFVLPKRIGNVEIRSGIAHQLVRKAVKV